MGREGVSQTPDVRSTDTPSDQDHRQVPPSPLAANRRRLTWPKPSSPRPVAVGALPQGAIPAALFPRTPFPAVLIEMDMGATLLEGEAWPPPGSAEGPDEGLAAATPPADGRSLGPDYPCASRQPSAPARPLGAPSEGGKRQAPLRSGNVGFQGFPRRCSFHYSAGE